MISCTKLNECEYEIKSISNHKVLGHFHIEVDGYFYFTPTPGMSGYYWEGNTLKKLSELLEDINKPHDDMIKKHFKNESQNRR